MDANKNFILNHSSLLLVPLVRLVVSGSEVSEGKRAGLGRSGRFHQRGERHAFTEPPEPHPPVRHRPHTAHEDGKTHTHTL